MSQLAAEPAQPSLLTVNDIEVIYDGAILAVAGVSLAWGTWILVRTLIFGHDIPGYASLFVAVTFLGGLQLIGIGIVGEYVGRTYIESKRRPPFVVRRVYRQSAERGSSAP